MAERGGHMPKQDYEEQYMHPELREEIKEEIKASDRGGKEGQWSARKSQLLTQEYEKQHKNRKTLVQAPDRKL
jgi:hypothetical protein